MSKQFFEYMHQGEQIVELNTYYRIIGCPNNQTSRHVLSLITKNCKNLSENLVVPCLTFGNHDKYTQLKYNDRQYQNCK